MVITRSKTKYLESSSSEAVVADPTISADNFSLLRRSKPASQTHKLFHNDQTTLIGPPRPRSIAAPKEQLIRGFDPHLCLYSNTTTTRSQRKFLESREQADVAEATISTGFSLLRRSEINGSYKPKEEYSLADFMAILKSTNISGRQLDLVKVKLQEHKYWRIMFLVMTPEQRLDWATGLIA
ncbi:hypothetical protein LguiB_020382 [Lonicera macranthoides]